MKALLLVSCLAMSACGVQNMARTSDQDCRDYFAGEFKESIDRAVAEELAHEPPNGYKTKPYAPSQWQDYWNSRIYYIYNIGPNQCHGGYHGPTGPEFIAYIVQERRAHGLPDLVLEPRNAGRVL
jgi:hypothetical protein